MTKKEIITAIKGHIQGCTKNRKDYLKQEEYAAALDMKARIDGLNIALSYVVKLDKQPSGKKL